MADDLRMKLGIDTGQAVGDLHKAAGAADDLTSALDDNRSAAQKVADEINSATDTIVAQLKSDVDAADALAKAMGPELLSTADGGIQGLIAKLKDLGLTSDQIKADAQALGDAFKRSDEAVDELKRLDGELDQIDTDAKTATDSLERVGKADVTPASTSAHHLGDEMDHVKDRTGKAGEAVHSMSGNAVGDFAAATSGVGPLGEALGQMTETALGGEASLKQIATAGLGLGALSGGMLLVNGLLSTFAKEAAEAAKIKAFNVENAKVYSDAIEHNTNAIDDYIEKARTAGGVKIAPNIDEQTRAFAALGTALPNDKLTFFTKGIQDVGPLLIAAKSSAQEYYDAAVNGGDALDDFTTKVRNSNLSVDEQAKLLAAVFAQQDNVAKGAKTARDDTALYTKASDDLTASTAAYANAAIHADDVTADFKRSTDDIKRAQEQATTASENHRKALEDEKQATQNLIDQELSQIDKKYAARQADGDAADAVANLTTVLADHKSTMKDVANATDDAFNKVLDKTSADLNAKGVVADSRKGIEDQITSLQNEANALDPGSPLRSRLLEYINDLKNIPTQIATDLHLSVTGDNPSNFLGGKGAHAAGGTVGPREVSSLIDEEGPEILTLPGGTQVMTARATAAYLAAAQRADAGSTTINNFTIHTHAGLSARDLAAELRRRARRNGTSD